MAAGTLTSFAKSISAAGTAERLIASSTITAEAVIQAHPDNAGNIFIGGSDVDSSNGYILEPGDSFSIASLRHLHIGDVEDDPQIDLTDVWIDSAQNNDGVRVAYIERS